MACPIHSRSTLAAPLLFALLGVVAVFLPVRAAHGAPLAPCPDGSTARARQCLVGPVNSVAITTAKFRHVEGDWVREEPKPSWVSPSTVYDPRGNLAEERIYDVGGGLRSESVYLYDTTGRLRESLTFATDGALQARVVFTYDGRGRHSGEERFGAGGEPQARVTYAHDVMGRLIEESVFNHSGAFMLRWVYSYDAVGRRSREALYTSRSMIVRGPVSRSFRYGEPDGRLVEELAFDAAGTLLDRVMYRYDQLGHRTEEVRYDPDGFQLGTTAFEYEFDGPGNWITRKRVKRYGNLSIRPLDMTYRSVTYFEPPQTRASLR